MEWKRNCPKCGKELYYSDKYHLASAIKKNTLCITCSRTGDKNSFFGKHHSEESKDKYRKSREVGYENHKYKTKEYREKQSTLHMGNKNSMFGRSVYSVWLEKYGKEIADLKMIEFKKKESIANSGSNNSMYGKPSPQGSGNGWCGWYKGWFFRSLMELSYMILVIERFNIPWKSGECKEYMIKYINYDGKERNYFPDFILNEKYIVEIKPISLIDTPKVNIKKKYATNFCNKNNLIYKLRNINSLNMEQIMKLHDSGLIKFIDRYELKYKKYIQNEK